MSVSQEQRHLINSLAFAATTKGEIYVLTLLNQNLPKENDGLVDVTFDKSQTITQQRIVIGVTYAKVIFYPAQYSDFASLHPLSIGTTVSM